MRGALEVRNLSLAYPQGGKALENVSFSLQYGDFALLAGDSGSGKSSLLSCINGVIPQINRGEMQGEILLDGVAAAGVKMGEIARRVGSVLQDPDSQIFHSRVEDEIAFGCENLNMPPEEIRRRVEESCALFQLEREAFTRRLSGGQKQRLLTACVFAMGQKILLLDEPLANLDREAAGRLLGSLKELCRRGYAVLLAEHRLDIALPPADRLLCLEGRRLVEREPGSFAFPSPGNFSPAPHDGESRSGETLLEAAGLSYSVKEREILRDVSLSIRRGERVALLGENGSGKTTLLRLLAGLIKPSGGALRADLPGRPGSRKWFRSVGYVYQNPSYQLFMPTVEEELAQGAAAGWARRCLEDFDLAALATRHPLSLSEGEKRRLSIAAVLAGQPRLLLLDEPTVGQDQRQLERMINALNRIHRETGNAMVTVTHDPRCAEALADRAIQLENGSVFSSDIFSFR